MGGILKDPGNQTEAWSERVERKVSRSRGELCGDKSSHNRVVGEKMSEWASEDPEGSGSNSNLRTKV